MIPHHRRSYADKKEGGCDKQKVARERMLVQSVIAFDVAKGSSKAHVLLVPAYRGVFGTLCSQVTLKVLVLSDGRGGTGVSGSDSAQSVSDSSDQIFPLTMYVDSLTTYYENLTTLEKQLGALAETIPACHRVQIIPGIGKKIVATIVGEIERVDRLSNPKKLAAFAGAIPWVFFSGKFTATFNRITKCGSSTLQHTLFMAVLCGLRKTGSQRLKTFYDQKRQEGKAHKVVVIACINKLLHWIYAILKREEAFIDIA